jgi:hypothetical protein
MLMQEQPMLMWGRRPRLSSEAQRAALDKPCPEAQDAGKGTTPVVPKTPQKRPCHSEPAQSAGEEPMLD